ncbi:M1 family metallopeptidase [Actinacidiphila sp. DG2A-62]|uniref:M1 family metallopeptidase n=1 Tax=Actinacidiphila sp. DG2A-62 TaxID=3108821 RepID=UPI002DB935BE|nr:M1 family metallopeptidase [Actinacidiphila sp. DG2A-62]MEC3998347.1 M1 family metallopeptidase [Actinacidiphila sp. DG2A-62]
MRPRPLRLLVTLLLACCLAACADGAAAPVNGSPGVGDPLFPTAGNGGYDVGHYGLDLSYDPPSGRIEATAALTATAREPLASFDLDLSGLTVTSVTVGGRSADFSRKGTELVVTPAQPLPAGRRFETTVVYQGVPGLLTDPDGSQEGWFHTDDGGALALGEPVGSMAWFPGDDHPSDKATYDITVTVPHPMTVVANGELAGTAPRPGGRTAFHWHVAQPMATYLATVAIGDYTVQRSRTASGLPVYTAVDPRSDDPQTAASLARIPEIVDWESSIFGPFPFSSTGAVVAHLGDRQGGYALETQNRPTFPGNEGTPAVPVTTLVHELSHEWFGDWVTPHNWQDIWLNEGFATYTEWLWKDHEGVATEEQSAQAAFADADNWAFAPASPDAKQVFAPAVYGRGALVLHELRRALGDKAFFRMLRAWPAAHPYGNASTQEFTAFCADFTGKNLTPLFATWLYGRARPAHL